MTVHKITGIGNLTRTPELRFLQNGNAVISCTVAVNDSYKKNDETITKVTYWQCDLFGAQAERIAQRNYEKGFKVYFEGLPDIEMKEDKNGTMRLNTRVKFATMEKIGGKIGVGDFHAADIEEDEEPDVPKTAPKNDEVF